MTKRRWKGYMKSIGSHIDPEKEEQLKWFKIETENKVRRILKLIKSINQGNKDGNMKKKSELIQLTEDFHKQYESLYVLYDNLRAEIRRRVNVVDEDGSTSSASSSDIELYYSPEDLNQTGESSSGFQKVTDGDHQKPDSSDVEDTVLKDKLTSTSEVKETWTLNLPSSFSQVSESGEVIKDLGVEAEQPEIARQKLIAECAWLKEKLIEKDEELLSLTKKHQLYECGRLSRINQLEGQVANLKLELEIMSTQKKEFEEQLESKSNEAKEMEEEISRLRDQIMEVGAISQKKEDQFSAFQKKCEENELNAVTRIEGVKAKANDLQLEVESLRTEKSKLEEQLCCKAQEGAAQVKGLTEELNILQQKLESLRSQNGELEVQLERKSQELSESLLQIDGLKEKLSRYEKKAMEEKEGLKVQVKDLEVEVNSLCGQKSDLEEQIASITGEAYHSRVEQEELQGKISELQTTLTEREDELFTIRKEYEAHKNDTSHQIITFQAQISNLKQELQTLQAEKGQLQLELESEKQQSLQSLTQMEKKNAELTNKIADQQKTVTGLEDVVNKLKEENKQVQGKLVEFKSNFQAGAERKIEEIAEEFRKQFEDNLIILSRRIRVAEQLQVESKEWYRKNRTNDEHGNKDLKKRLEKYEAGIRNIKDMSLTANDILASLDTVALKFEEFTANFLNRISKSSCELKFAKDWVMRKNKAISHVKEDLDCLLAQLDEKEAEILSFREKVWKSENRVRELEKMIKEKEDCMLGLKEEKREAIRQLCVWIDYHRSRSDYYKKTLTDITVGYRRTG